MDIDLIVVGGGFWGCAIANRALEAGLSVHLVDNGYEQSGSRNASGLANRNWLSNLKGLPAWWTKQDTADAFQWIADMGGQTSGEYFSSYLNPAPRWRSGLVSCPDLWRFLETGAKRHEGSVIRVVRGVLNSDYSVETSSGWLFAPRVVLAAGTHTDHLLNTLGLPPVGVSGVRGRSLILKGKMRWTAPRTHLTRPYTCFTLKHWKEGYLHLGATTERTWVGGQKQFVELLAVAAMLAPRAKVVEVLDGYRPVCPSGPVVQQVAQGLIVATGAGKVGLAMARPVANRVLGML